MPESADIESITSEVEALHIGFPCGSVISPERDQDKSPAPRDIMSVPPIPPQSIAAGSDTTTIILKMEAVHSKLDGIVLHEKIPIRRITGLLKSDFLVKKWDAKSYYSHEQSARYHKTETDQITAYLQKYDHETEAVPVKYRKPSHHKWGRVFPERALGLTSFALKTRNALLNGLYVDLDLKNAQLEILLFICENNDVMLIKCDKLREYCENRGQIIQSVMDTYGVERWKAKQLFIRMTFLGSPDAWLADHGCGDKELTPFIKEFRAELDTIANDIKRANATLYDFVRKKNDAKLKKALEVAKTEEAKEAIRKKKKNNLGSFLSYFLQEHETRVLESCFDFLINKTSVMDHPNGVSTAKIGTYEYDGMKLLRVNVEAYPGGVHKLIEALNAVVESQGFPLTFEEKPIEKLWDIVEEDVSVTSLNKIVTVEKIRYLTSSDRGVVESIMQFLPGHFFYNSELKDFFCWDRKKWRKGDEQLKRTITDRIAEYWDSLLVQLEDYEGIEKLKTSVTKDAEHLRSSAKVSSCIQMAKTFLLNNAQQFDEKQFLVGFDNGVFDLETNTFRPHRLEDYTTYSCKFDFVPMMLGMNVESEDGQVRVVTESDLSEEDKQKFNTLMEKLTMITPDDEERRLLLVILSTGICGLAIEKMFVWNGNGRNGKGFINELVLFCFGDYFASIDSSVLTTEKKKGSSNPNPEVAQMHKKRYILTKEPAKNIPLQNSAIKAITGGGTVKARELYSNKTDVELLLTLVMETNDIPLLKEEPIMADAERLVTQTFGSTFTPDSTRWDCNTGKTMYFYPQDTSLKTVEWKTAHRNAFMNIVLGTFPQFLEHGCKVDPFIPKSVKEQSKAYLQKSQLVHTTFLTYFEKRDENKSWLYKNYKGEVADVDWTLAKIVTQLKRNNKLEEAGYNIERIHKFFRENEIYRDSVYHNSSTKQNFLRDYRRIPKEDDEED